MSRAAKRHRMEKAHVKQAAKARSEELANPQPVFDLERFKAIVAETLKERKKLDDELPEST